MSFFHQQRQEQRGREDFERGRSRQAFHEDFWDGEAYNRGYREARREQEEAEARERADEHMRQRLVEERLQREMEEERRAELLRQEMDDPDPHTPEPFPEPEPDPLVQAIIDVHNSDWDYHI